MKKMILIMVVMIHQSLAQVLPSDVQRLIDQRDAAVEKVNQAFVAELLKLKVKATDPKVRTQIDSLLSGQGGGGASVPEDPMMGVWFFKPGQGGLRRYEFKPNGNFTAVGARGPFSGKWIRDGKALTIYMQQTPELPWASITQKTNGSLELKIKQSGEEWEGRRADKW